MRLKKFLSMIIFVTVVSCFYVCQQTEIIRLAYAGQKKKASFEDLLDKNGYLRYNLEKSISLVRIGEQVSKASDLQMPDNYRLVRVASYQQGLKLGQDKLKQQNILARIFGINRQAEAKTIP